MPKKIFTSDIDIDGDLTIKSANINYQENLDVDTGLVRIVAIVDKATCNAAFFDYVVFNGSNVRAGTVVSSHNALLQHFMIIPPLI